MKLYGAIDLHSTNSVVSLIDEQDRVVYQKRLDNNLTVLTEHSEAAADIDPAQARTAFDEATAAHADELTVARARARKRIAESSR